jgi:hypothetical protein
MKICLVAEISAQHYTLHPFAKILSWTLPKNFSDHVCSFTLIGPQSFGPFFQDDFYKALKNIQLLSESITFPCFGEQNDFDSRLDIEQLFLNN